MPNRPEKPIYRGLRLGEAAKLLGVSVETLRRWEAGGRVRTRRSSGGQRLIGLPELQRLQAERRRARPEPPIVAQSSRNRFPGIVTRVERDRVAAVVERSEEHTSELQS